MDTIAWNCFCQIIQNYLPLPIPNVMIFNWIQLLITDVKNESCRLFLDINDINFRLEKVLLKTNYTHKKRTRKDLASYNTIVQRAKESK